MLPSLPAPAARSRPPAAGCPLPGQWKFVRGPTPPRPSARAEERPLPPWDRGPRVPRGGQVYWPWQGVRSLPRQDWSEPEDWGGRWRARLSVCPLKAVLSGFKGELFFSKEKRQRKSGPEAERLFPVLSRTAQRLCPLQTSLRGASPPPPILGSRRESPTAERRPAR